MTCKHTNCLNFKDCETEENIAEFLRVWNEWSGEETVESR